MFTWIVVDENGQISSGEHETFDEAIRALGDWHGDGSPPNLSYQILST